MLIDGDRMKARIIRDEAFPEMHRVPPIVPLEIDH